MATRRTVSCLGSIPGKRHSKKDGSTALSFASINRIQQSLILPFRLCGWNRGWTTNIQWFFAHRARLIQYFAGLGFDVGRNEGSGWHRRTSWLPPYDVKGLKYANAFWKPRIPLRNDDRAVTPWDTLLNRSLDGCFGLAKIVDGLSVE
jgi:hypothetical protein